MVDRVEEIIRARGHPQITAEHSSTFMVTRDGEIGIEADCVIGVSADKGAADLREEIKRELSGGREAKITLEADGEKEEVVGRGDEELSFTDPADLVVRASDFTCGRTLLVEADKAAVDLSRDFVKKLRDPSAELEITLIVLP